jgi:hypothetical protein
MSAASSATSGPPVNVSAFIMTHGGVEPDIYTEEENEYILSANPLPPKTQLFAPSILGYSYYDHQESELFIDEIHVNYIKKQSPRPDYILYCLDTIREFEKIDVARKETAIKISGAKQHPPEKEHHERAKRLIFSETVLHKSRVEWHPHTHYIRQKTYSIHANDKPKNSIMFFCEQDLSAIVSSEEFKQKFNNSFTTHRYYGIVTGEIYYVVGYDQESRVCSIRFINMYDVNVIPFFTIHEILSNVVSFVLPGRDVHLSIFDFSCSDIRFPHLTGGNETIFLSSEQHSRPFPRLVYGIIPKDRATEMKRKEHGQLPYAYLGSPSPQPRQTTLRSFMNSVDAAAAAAADTPSPGRAPSVTLTVYLLDHVESFVDFESKFEGRSRSVSPILPIGGSRESTRRRHSRHHPRVGKKVSLRDGRRRRRGTKGRSRRNTHKR